MATKETRIQVVIVGDVAIGKTPFCLTFMNNPFPESWVITSVIPDVYSTNMMVDGKPVSLSLWDTGKHQFNRATLTYPDFH